MGQFALKLLVDHWKASAIVALVFSLAGGCAALWVQRDHALVERGRALERARVADSTLAATAKTLARIDTQLVHDTVTVRQTIARVDSLRDTLLLHKNDTVLVDRYITRTDSALKACTELAGDCVEFRRVALQRFAAYEAKIAAIPSAAPPRSCIMSNVVWGVLGAGGGYFIGRR